MIFLWGFHPFFGGELLVSESFNIEKITTFAMKMSQMWVNRPYMDDIGWKMMETHHLSW